jgi:hypothetical protein
VHGLLVPEARDFLAGDEDEPGSLEVSHLDGLDQDVVIGDREKLIPVIPIPRGDLSRRLSAVAARRVRVDVAALELAHVERRREFAHVP